MTAIADQALLRAKEDHGRLSLSLSRELMGLNPTNGDAIVRLARRIQWNEVYCTVQRSIGMTLRQFVLTHGLGVAFDDDIWRWEIMYTQMFWTFLITFALHLYFTARASKLGRRFTKPFLMPLLLLLYLIEADVVSNWIVLALISGTLGDIFLLWPDDDRLFTAGLVSFMAGHICYAVAISQTVDFSGQIPWWFWLAIIPYAAFGWYLVTKLDSDLGKMKVPSIVYGLVIILMSLFSILRVCNFSGWGFWLPFTGSLLFVASDSLLAHNTFRAKIDDADLYIMATYVLAQFFIVTGLLMG